MDTHHVYIYIYTHTHTHIYIYIYICHLILYICQHRYSGHQQHGLDRICVFLCNRTVQLHPLIYKKRVKAQQKRRIALMSPGTIHERMRDIQIKKKDTMLL